MAINFLQDMFGGNQPMPQRSAMGGNFASMVGGAPGMLPPDILESVQNAPQQAAPQQPAAPQRERRSLLDTVGRISDVLARVGGAEALYQPTLDAREDRTRGIDIEGMRKQLLEQQIAAGGDEAAMRGTGMLGTAVRGLKAIQQRGGDIATAWPILARQTGIPEDKAVALGQLFGENPEAMDAFIAMQDERSGASDFSMQPFYATDQDGNVRAFQLGRDGTVKPIELGEGVAPIDPLKFVDLGGEQAGVGTRSGRVRRVLPNSVDPNTGANIQSRERIAARGNQSRERVAAMRGSGADSKGPSPSEIAQGAAPVVAGLRDAATRLFESGGMTDENSGVMGTTGTILRETVPFLERYTSPEGFSAREDLDRLLTVGIPSLLPLMGGLQLGGKNIDAAKELETWRKAIASAKDYPSAIRAIEGFEKRIAELTAPEQAAPRRTNNRRVQPRAASRPAGGRSGGGWGKATVVGD